MLLFMYTDKLDMNVTSAHINMPVNSLYFTSISCVTPCLAPHVPCVRVQ